MPFPRIMPLSPRTKVFALLAVFSILICLSLSLFVQAKRLVGETAQQISQYIQDHTGFAISFKEHDIGFGTVQVEEVEIHKQSTSTIGSISAELNMNPFRGSLGKPERLRIKLVKAKASFRQFKEDFLRKTTAAGHVATPDDDNQAMTAMTGAAVVAVKDLLNHPMLPQVMSVENGTFILTDDNNQDLFSLNKLNLTYNRNRGLLQFTMDSMSYRQQRFFEKVSGDINIAATGDAYPFTLSYKDAAGKQQWHIRGRLQKDISGLSFFAKNRGLPKDLEPWLGKYLVDPQQFHYAAKVNVSVLKGNEGFAFGTQIAFGNLKVKHPLLGVDPIGPAPVRVRAYGQFSPHSNRLTINQGSLTLKKLGSPQASPVVLQFSLHKDQVLDTQSPLPWHLSLSLPPSSCQNVLDAAPPGLMPKLAHFRLQGDMSLNMDLSLPPKNLERFTYRFNQARFQCQVIGAPYTMSRERLLTANPLDIDKQAMADEPELYVPLPREYVTLDQVPSYFYKSLIVAEDGGFWFHKGFEWEAMESALRRNLAEREVTIGGSTISMQTAKNLFLDQKRTLTRKLQEIFLTWHLERQLPKRKILEIYMNIIDFGPGIKGIAKASRHFFDKEPKNLSVAEAAYLATVLPSPGKRYRNYCEGRVTGQYRPVVQRNLEGLLALNAISMEQYATASRDDILFHRPQTTVEACETIANASSPLLVR